jgi:hypothetical protein
MGVVAIDVWVLIQPGRSFFTRLCCACELWLESFREQRMVIKKNPRFRVASSVQLVPGKEKQKNYWVDHRGPKKFLERKKNEWITGLVECLANWRRQRVRLSIAHAAVATRREMQACVLSRPLSCRFQTVSPVGIVQEKIGFDSCAKVLVFSTYHQRVGGANWQLDAFATCHGRISMAFP